MAWVSILVILFLSKIASGQANLTIQLIDDHSLIALQYQL